MIINPVYFLILIPALLAWLVHARVRKIYEINEDRFSKQDIIGRDAARKLLDRHGLNKVNIERVAGSLTDHYDPVTKTLRLSKNVASSQSITALGIVAHEVGHAIQDFEGYYLMRLRTSMALRISTATQWSSIIFIGGFIFRIPVLMIIAGLFLFVLLLFTLVTLPVERNASTRALKMLQDDKLIREDEKSAVRQVLNAAAFTYLASFGQRLAGFLFFVVVILLARGVPQ